MGNKNFFIVFLILLGLILLNITCCGYKIDIKPFDIKDFHDKDDNDTKKTAVEVTTQNPIIGFFDEKKNSGDIDFYKVYFSLKNTSYKVLLSGVPGIDSKMVFYGYRGDYLFVVDRLVKGEAEKLWDYYPRYDFIIISVEAKTGFNKKIPYIINFIPKKDEGINEIEPNNDRENAVVIKIGEEKKGLISPKDDIDYYKLVFDDEKTHNFSIKIETLSNLDINFTIMKSDDDLSKYINSFGWGGKEFFSFISNEKGDFYIKVGGVIKNDDVKDPLYYLKIEELPGREEDKDLYYEKEFNDSSKLATDLIEGTEIIGAFYPENDEDWFKFDLFKKPISVDISLSGIREVDSIIELYDKDLKLIKTINEKGEDIKELLSKNDISGGRYFLKIYGKKSLQEYRLFYNARY